MIGYGSIVMSYSSQSTSQRVPLRESTRRARSLARQMGSHSEFTVSRPPNPVRKVNKKRRTVGASSNNWFQTNDLLVRTQMMICSLRSLKQVNLGCFGLTAGLCWTKYWIMHENKQFEREKNQKISNFERCLFSSKTSSRLSTPFKLRWPRIGYKQVRLLVRSTVNGVSALDNQNRRLKPKT